MRNHYMNGYLSALADEGVPPEAVSAIKENFDISIKVFGTEIPLGAMYGILLGSCAVLLAAFIAIIIIKNKSKKRSK